MADGFGYGGFTGVPYPFWLPPPSPHPSSASTPTFLTTHPVRFDPMIPHGSYHQSPSCDDNSRSLTPSSSFYVQPGNLGPRREDSCEDVFSSQGGYYPSIDTSSDVVYCPPTERQRLDWVPYSSATASSFADMLIRNSQEPFYKPIPPSGVCASRNAFDLNRPVHYYSGYDKHERVDAVVSGTPVESYVCVPSMPMSSFKTEPFFDGSGIRVVGDGRSFHDVAGSHSPENIQSSLPSSSVQPVNFNVLSGYGEATGHVKPLSENPDLRDVTVGWTGSRSPRSSQPLQFNSKSSGSLYKEKGEAVGVSSLYQKPNTLVADSENGVSESSLKNTIGDMNCDEHRSWNHFMVSSEGPLAPTMFSTGNELCGTMKADNGNAVQSAVDYNTPSEGSSDQPSEDVQASQKTCKFQEQLVDIMDRDKKTTLLTDLSFKESSRSNADGISTGQSPVCDQGDFTSPASSTRVSSVVNAMHNLSEVLVYECFSNRSLLKPEQLENLDKVVENLTKCLNKITCNKTIAGEASVPAQAIHVSCPNVVDLNETPNVVAKDCQGFNVKLLDSFGFKESVDKDKNEMTQSIKNILASNFPDGEENHPQTLFFKNLWLETEAALCSTTCLARYHRIQKESGNLKLQNREISADASTFILEPFLNPRKSVSIINNVGQGMVEPLIKHGSNCGNDVVPMSHDAPQSSRFNSAPIDAVLSLLSRSSIGCLEQENHGNFKPGAQIPDTIQQESPASTAEEKHNDVIDRFQILKHQETKRKLKSQNCPDPDVGVIDRFHILKQQETNRKLKFQDCSETRMDDQEANLEAWEMATIGRSSHMNDVMGRFQILKGREAEQVKKSLNNVDLNSDFDSDSDNDQPRNKTQMCDDYLLSDWMMTTGGNSKIETCANTEPSAYDKGYESPTSDWEHVLKDD